MTDIIEMTTVTHVVLDSGVLLHVFGTRDQVKNTLYQAEGRGEMFVDFDVQNDDAQNPVSQITVRLTNIALVGRSHSYEGPTSVPFPQVPSAREGTAEVVL